MRACATPGRRRAAAIRRDAVRRGWCRGRARVGAAARAHHAARRPRASTSGALPSAHSASYARVDRALHRPRGRGTPRPPPVPGAPPGGADPRTSSAPAVDELLVEDLEGRARLVVAHSALQQRVAVTQHAVVVGVGRGVPRRDGDEELVEVVATVRGARLHELEVVGREHGHAQRTEQVARPRERVPVEQHPVAGDHPDLGLHRARPSAGLLDRDAQDRLLRARCERAPRRAPPGTIGRARPTRSPRAGSSSPGRSRPGSP